MEKKFTFSFPLKLDSGGKVQRDQTPGSQVQLLAHTEIGQRLDDRLYGFPPYAYEQESLGDEIRRPVTLVLTQRAFAEYIPDMQLASIEVVREPVKRKLAMQITYTDRQRITRKQESQFDLGLDEG